MLLFLKWILKLVWIIRYTIHKPFTYNIELISTYTQNKKVVATCTLILLWPRCVDFCNSMKQVFYWGKQFLRYLRLQVLLAKKFFKHKTHVSQEKCPKLFLQGCKGRIVRQDYLYSEIRTMTMKIESGLKEKIMLIF